MKEGVMRVKVNGVVYRVSADGWFRLTTGAVKAWVPLRRDEVVKLIGEGGAELVDWDMGIVPPRRVLGGWVHALRVCRTEVGGFVLRKGGSWCLFVPPQTASLGWWKVDGDVSVYIAKVVDKGWGVVGSFHIHPCGVRASCMDTAEWSGVDGVHMIGSKVEEDVGVSLSVLGHVFSDVKKLRVRVHSDPHARVMVYGGKKVVDVVRSESRFVIEKITEWPRGLGEVRESERWCVARQIEGLAAPYGERARKLAEELARVIRKED